MATPSILRRIGDTAKTKLKEYSPLPDSSDLAGLKAVQDNVNQEAGARHAAPTSPPAAEVMPQDRINAGRHYGDRPGEKLYSPAELKEMTHPLGSLPTYDSGGDVNVKDGNHQLAILQDGEKVLTPEQAEAYNAAKNMPVESHERLRPQMQQEEPKVGPLGTAMKDKEDTEHPLGDEVKQPSSVAPEETIQAPQGEGTKPKLDPNSPAGQMIQKDKETAAQKGDLVGLGTALLNEKHMAPVMGSPAPELPTYGGPGKPVEQGQLIPQDQIHHDKIASYDQRIQDALDKAAATNDPAYQEQADRLKLAKLQYEKTTPYGSATNHPGVLGEIGHIAAKAGNIAGDFVAPHLMEEIPGTQLNKYAQASSLGSALKEDTVSNLAQQEERTKERALEIGKTPEQRTYNSLLAQGYSNEDALRMIKEDEQSKEKESYINDSMKQTNPTTGRPNTREEATQQYYQMRAGAKPANPKEQEIQDHLKAMKLPDTPENRDLARNDLQRRKTETAQMAALPYAEQKIRLQSSLSEANADLNRTGNDALQRGEKADEFALKENERHNLRVSQIESAENALDQSDNNMLAASIVPVLATMTESNSQGIKRLNPQELAKFMPKSSGDAKQWFEAHYDQLTAGQIPEQYRGDLKVLLAGLSKEEGDQNQTNLKSIDDTLRKGAVQPKVNEHGKANSTEKSKSAATETPTAQNNKYHVAGAKGEIVSNDGKTWYDLNGKLIK
jgi:hypothetical protein